jgi:hypothetical protein
MHNMRRFLLFMAAFGLMAATAVAQGVAPGGGFYNSTGIGSGLGGVIGGTGPSYPNGTTAPATAPAIPPGGLPPVGHIDRTPAPPSQLPSAATTRSPYPEQADPYYPTSSRRNTAAAKNGTGKAAGDDAAGAASMAR